MNVTRSQKHLDFGTKKQALLPVVNELKDSIAGDIQSYKNALKKGDQIIHNIYIDHADIRSVIHLRTYLVDQVILNIWNNIFTAEVKSKIALVAVGGYGRGELHPFSDVDIMVLLRDSQNRELEKGINSFITQLWDIGLDIGHSVRTVEECISESTLDLTVITNLMEARLLEGSMVLFGLMMEAIEPESTWSSDAFFHAKIEERENRYSRFHDTAYRLEPNIKESPGGLRDIQMIGWISRRHFGTEKIYELVESRFISKEEYNSLIEGQYLLWEIRYLLHRFTNRREDRLLFDYQRDLAHHFGFAIEEKNLSIESFMQNYYRTVMQMQRLNDMILQKFQETLQERKEPAAFQPINERFQLRNGYIETCQADLFGKRPASILEVFSIYSSSEDIKGIRANTIRQIRANLHALEKPLSKESRAPVLFMQIISDPNKLTRKLRLMNRYGVMAAYLPDFENIVGRMQYDLFHIYTVDEHSIGVIRNLRRFTIDRHKAEFPHCSMIIDQIRRPELLYIIGLFHDIAKGREGDHSQLGAIAVGHFCDKHKLSEDEKSLIQWTVENHLLMSMTAQRRDITDPDVINNFAEQVITRERLNHLYLLTVADIRATNPELWNSWKDSLLQTLFKQTARALHRGLDSPIEKEEAIKQKMLEAMTGLEEYKLEQNSITQLWDNLGEEYFLRYFSNEIIWHSKEILLNSGNTPLVKFRKESDRGSTEILVYTLDHSNLFELIVSELGRLGLNILTANVGTTAGDYALNTFLVLEQNDNTISSAQRINEIRKSLLSCLHNPDKLPKISNQKVPRRLRHFSTEPKVTIDNELSEAYTSIYIEAVDRPGVLSRIARCFFKSDIQIHSAKIATLGEKVEDVFFVTDRQHRQLDNDKLLNTFRNCILTELTDK